MAFFHLSVKETWTSHVKNLQKVHTYNLTIETLIFLQNLEVTFLDYVEYKDIGVWCMDFRHANDLYHYRQNEYLDTCLPYPNPEDNLHNLFAKNGKITWKEQMTIREIIQAFLVSA